MRIHELLIDFHRVVSYLAWPSRGLHFFLPKKKRSRKEEKKKTVGKTASNVGRVE